MSMTNQEILKAGEAAEGWTHYVLENGTNYYFKVYQLNAEIWTEDGWLEYETTCALPDLEGVRSRKDIERIVELEQEIESYKRAFIEMESNEVSRRKAQHKRDLEQQAKGIEDAATELASPYGAIPVDALHEYAKQLRKKAKELDK